MVQIVFLDFLLLSLIGSHIWLNPSWGQSPFLKQHEKIEKKRSTALTHKKIKNKKIGLLQQAMNRYLPTQ
jgi:hypothetical protein